MQEIDYQTFIRDKITALRLRDNVSEYQMSLDLGQNKNYIQSICSGKALPSMASFLNIFDYFGVSPMEFFDIGIEVPMAVKETAESLLKLESSDFSLISDLVERLNKY